VPRLQLTLARYQAQQNRVERLEREQRTVQSQIAIESSGREHMAAAVTRGRSRLARHKTRRFESNSKTT